MILLSVQLSSLLFGMTITLANVVLPQIRGALSATYDEIAWVVTLNLVATGDADDRLAGDSTRLARCHVQRRRRLHAVLAIMRTC